MPSAGFLVLAFAAAAGLSAAATALCLPRLRQLAVRQHIREDVPETHLAKAGTPSMGGVPMMGAVVVATLMLGAAGGGLSPRTVACLGVMLGFAVVGLVDDVRKLGDTKSRGVLARYRIAVELLMAVAFASGVGSGVTDELGRATWLGTLTWPAHLAVALGAVVVVASANAANLTDGLDGLAAGLSAIAALALAIVATALGMGDMALLAVIIAGGAAGFLTLNAKPARVWMGDVGSLGLGAVLGAVAVALRVEFLFALLALVFAAEALSVILQVASFQTTGKRVFRMAPLHHHFELAGMAETHVVGMFWAAGAAAAVAGLSLFYLGLPVR